MRSGSEAQQQLGGKEMIDWTRPVIRKTDPDDAPPGRVLCTDQPGKYPVAVWWPDSTSPFSYTMDGRIEADQRLPAVRNVPPRKVKQERWVLLCRGLNNAVIISQHAYDSKEDAYHMQQCNSGWSHIVRIEWEEEE
jgi:hypothetical protein